MRGLAVAHCGCKDIDSRGLRKILLLLLLFCFVLFHFVLLLVWGFFLFLNFYLFFFYFKKFLLDFYFSIFTLLFCCFVFCSCFCFWSLFCFLGFFGHFLWPNFPYFIGTKSFFFFLNNSFPKYCLNFEKENNKGHQDDYGIVLLKK